MTVYEQERKKELGDIEQLMGTAQGRRIMHRLLKATRCMDSPIIVTDYAAISFYEGQRSIGYEFFKDIMETVPKKFTVMILEGKERDELIRELIKKEMEQGKGQDDEIFKMD